MTFLYWRINLSGNPYDEGRVAWACVGAMAIATSALIINQTLFRNVRLLYRFAPIIILTVVTIFSQWKWMDRPPATDILFEVLLVAILMSCSSMVHLFFLRKRRDLRVDVNTASRGFSLSELFGWTGLAALMLSPIKLYSVNHWMRGLSWETIVVSFCAAVIITSATLSAYLLTAKRCYLVFQLLGGSLLAVFVTVSAACRMDWVDLNFNLIGTIYFDAVAVACERLLAVVFGSVLLALPIGMRHVTQVTKTGYSHRKDYRDGN
jgi:hypothetical protein